MYWTIVVLALAVFTGATGRVKRKSKHAVIEQVSEVYTASLKPSALSEGSQDSTFGPVTLGIEMGVPHAHRPMTHGPVRVPRLQMQMDPNLAFPEDWKPGIPERNYTQRPQAFPPAKSYTVDVRQVLQTWDGQKLATLQVGAQARA